MKNNKISSHPAKVVPTLSALDMVTAILFLNRGSATRAVLGNVGYYRKPVHFALHILQLFHILHILEVLHILHHFSLLKSLTDLTYDFTELGSLTRLFTPLESLAI